MKSSSPRACAPAAALASIFLLFAPTAATPQAASGGGSPTMAAATVTWLCTHLGQGGNCSLSMIAPVEYDPQMLSCNFCTVGDMIIMVHGIGWAQIEGDPGWLAGDRYRVRIAASAPATRKQMMQFLGRVLTEAFGLRYHIETKPSPVYRLEVGKGSPKFLHTAPSSQTKAAFMAGDRTFSSVSELVTFLNNIYYNKFGSIDHPVVDATGLTGTYNIHLITGPGVSLGEVPWLALVKEQLGLAVVPAQGQESHFVIDSVEHFRGKWTGP